MASELSTLLVTPEHLIRAEVQTGGRRLLEMINDGSTDFLRVGVVKLYRRACGTFVAEAPSAVIRKSNVALALPEIERHEAPQKRYDNFVTKRSSEAFLIALGYEVYGKLYLRGSGDPISAFSHELLGFFPVADADVCCRGTPGTDRSSPVVIVNSAFVSLLRIGEFTRPGADGPAPAAAESVQALSSVLRT